MSGRYLEDTVRAKVTWGILILTLAAWGAQVRQLNQMYCGNEEMMSNSNEEIVGNELIIKTRNVEELKGFAALVGARVEPLIAYTNPSEDALAKFGDCYVLTMTEGQESSINESFTVLKTQSWVEYVELDQMVTVGADIESLQEASVFNDPDPVPYTPNDPMFPNQWDKLLTETNWAWSVTKGSSAVIIAILDSGVDSDHTDLAQNAIQGYNFIDNNSNFQDDNGHGTKITGIAAAKIDNGQGIAGMAGNSSVMSLKIANGMGSVKRSDLISAIIYAADNGARVINVSAGFEGPSEIEEAAVEYAWSKGLLICASAGNDGICDLNHYPSSYEHVMSVGASTEDDSRAGFSNYGSNVDVYAPAKSVWLTLPQNGYGTGSGTSYASPQVAGLAALVWSSHPDWTNQEVWDAIIVGADTVETDAGKVLRINSRKSLGVQAESGIATENAKETFTVSAADVQNGVMKFTCESFRTFDYTLSVFDASGRVVYSESGNVTGTGQIECNQRFSSGTYFWRFDSGSGAETGKIVFLD